MEVDSMKEMFSRSEEKYGVQYVNYIGDGDSKIFKAILDLNPYGNDSPVKKSECVGHVEKRMGTRLRNVKKDKKLGGRGMLTDVLIKKITRYYGLATRRNTDSVQGMKKAIQATLDHLTSTDETPKHGNCPAGTDSWCKWRKAEAAGCAASFKHPPPLHPNVEKHLQPIFDDLSNDSLLERCLGGYTQNANESFNSTVWRLSPKHIHSGAKIVRIAAYIAASIFNEGYNAVLMIMNKLDIEIGILAHNFAITKDEKRINRQNRRSYSSSKEARTARRMEMMAQNEFYEEADGLLYAAVIAD
ncbi:PREDICTED: uncharacterized protein LOC106746604 [Dinoponera quadriceps]|uniref:Uncharacterized protein LOC106746604 n=1 Tax=Dinoponera quadriceps TaxID=609295 RepID=A0A6P3XLM5_DINQU|nr:PREDICTED: uncharacterized protein LOC106746604 [Dinoponera quadriceps]